MIKIAIVIFSFWCLATAILIAMNKLHIDTKNNAKDRALIVFSFVSIFISTIAEYPYD